MSTAEAALTVAGVLATSLTGTYCLIRRAAGMPSERDQIVQAAHDRAELARRTDPIVLALTDDTTKGDQ
ncbi:hypothetical protein [Streptomyces tauricus]|uniref:hypothetical protein n=1 Tax=Streptomyces tauricus TaxID=68274 RepID=UPI00343D878A